MTYQSVLLTIDQVAEEAAEASFDAHGHDVAPEMAWDFIINVLADTDDERLAMLPESMPRQFKHDYRRHCRLIREREAKSASGDATRPEASQHGPEEEKGKN